MDSQLKPGAMLRGKWRLDHFLGRGGMSSVYAATHRNGMRGAIKVLHREFNDNETVKKRFMREGYVANKVEHPGSVRVLDDDVTEDGLVFLVMELLEGETLKKRWIDCDRQMQLPTVLEIVDQVLDVLESAHRNKIVHRDIKPDNVFILENGAAKVLDFGIARVLEATLAGSADATSSGAMMGTPAFMPPEQALAHWHKVDGRSDLFALAATTYTLLSGRLIHSGSTMPELLIAAATQQAQPIRVIMPDLDENIAAVIDRALSFEIEARWPDARSMRLALLEAKTRSSGNRTVRLEMPGDAPATVPTSARTLVTAPPETEGMPTVVPTTTPLDSGRAPTMPTPVEVPEPSRAVTQAMAAVDAQPAPSAGARVVAKTTPHPRYPSANPRTMQSETGMASSSPPTAVWDATPVRLQGPLQREHVVQLAKMTSRVEPPRNHGVAKWVVGGVTAVGLIAAIAVVRSAANGASEEVVRSAPATTSVASGQASAVAGPGVPASVIVAPAGPSSAEPAASDVGLPSASAGPASASASPPVRRQPVVPPAATVGPCIEYSKFDGVTCVKRRK